MINVLCVDESAQVRERISNILSSHTIKTETTPGPQFAVHKIRENSYDVIILGVRKVAKGSLFLLTQIMAHKPCNVIVLLNDDADFSIENESWGRAAAQVFHYDGFGNDDLDEQMDKEVKDLAKSKVKQELHPDSIHSNVFEVSIYPDKPVYEKKIQSSRVILIGSSTGGIQIINSIISSIKEDLPPILVVQHMPEGFTTSMAHSLNKINGILVKEAENNDELFHGMVVIAPGKKHMVLGKQGNSYFVQLNDDPPLELFKPSVNKLFLSVADIMPDEVTAVILTGMGNDGTRGMLKLKELGADTLAQDEESSPVYGMPFEALKSGAAKQSLSVEGIIAHLNKLSKSI